MSHTIGQDNQQLNEKVSQDSQQPEKQTSTNSSLLTEGDYEFLFNQLLEGIAHGWHDQRIIKFFNQLGDRGKQEDWIAWLERLRVKVLTLPTQPKRQLGTMMIRLGELTRSATQVSEIGVTSNRIGRELLFGNTEGVIWEYAGPDLREEQSEVETEDELSKRLPKDFSQLGQTTIPDESSNQVPDTTVAEKSIVINVSENINIPSPTTNSVDSLVPDTEKLQDNVEGEQIELDLSLTDEKSPESIVTDSKTPEIDLSLDDLEEAVLDGDEFEFELSELDSEPLTQDEKSRLEQSKSAKISSEFTPDLAEKPQKILGNAQNTITNSTNSGLLNNDLLSPMDSQLAANSEAVDAKQIIDLIQEDQELAQQVSQKLNISLNNLVLDNNQSLVPKDSTSSSLELIESWFNLGLKQVSAGEFTKAISSWEKALKINPNLSEAWHNRGSALGRLGEYQKAVESFQNALKLDSNNYQAWNDHAHALYQLENWSEAVESWGNAIKLMPANHLFWYNRGCGLEQLENCTEAIISYEKSLEIKPDFQPARSRYINLVADGSRSN